MSATTMPSDEACQGSAARIPFYNPLDPVGAQIWPNYTLLMPVCAVGNIGQLACDLIISTLLANNQCQLIGRLYSPALMPVVGPNAYGLKGPPSTSTEVYESKKHKLIIIQQRTSYFKQLKPIYVQELVDWIKTSQFDQVVVLTSSFAQCNPDTSQLGKLTSSLQSITTSVFETNDKWHQLGLKSLPKNPHSIKVVQEDGLTYLAGSGLTKSLIKTFEKNFIRAAFLIDFCSEGINIQDCYLVVNVVDRLLNLSCGSGVTGGDIAKQELTTTTGWVEPFSWREADD